MKREVLFLCTGNSCCSHTVEAFIYSGFREGAVPTAIWIPSEGSAVSLGGMKGKE